MDARVNAEGPSEASPKGCRRRARGAVCHGGRRIRGQERFNQTSQEHLANRHPSISILSRPVVVHRRRLVPVGGSVRRRRHRRERGGHKRGRATGDYRLAYDLRYRCRRADVDVFTGQMLRVGAADLLLPVAGQRDGTIIGGATSAGLAIPASGGATTSVNGSLALPPVTSLAGAAAAKRHTHHKRARTRGGSRSARPTSRSRAAHPVS
jgi:hypothetical protein